MITYYWDWKQVPFTIACLVASVGILYSTLENVISYSPPIQQEDMKMTFSNQAFRPEVLERTPSLTKSALAFQTRYQLDRFYLAATMWGEARNQGETGMRAVGDVMLNRIGADPHRFGHSVSAAALRRKQFSCWNQNDPNAKKLNRVYLSSLSPTSKDGIRWSEAQQIADSILHGAPDSTHGALHYHEKSIRPFWVSRSVKAIFKLGSHLFYK